MKLDRKDRSQYTGYRRTQNIPTQSWQHCHAFGQDIKWSGEVRTMIVIAITATMTVVEIATGMIFGSIALIAQSS